MAYIKCLTDKHPLVQIPYWFITNYMPKAQGGYLKVYLYLLALTSNTAETALSLPNIAKELDMLYSELIQALKYWDQEGVLAFKEPEADCFELIFYLEKPMEKSAPAVPKLPISKMLISESRPEYRTEEINLYIEDNAAVAKLFKIAEEYLGRLLTSTDQKILFSFYDWLHMPFDLIEFLIEHCASNNHTAIRYLEKVAISWVDAGITTVEKAKEKVTLDKKYFKILSALGSSKSNITPSEKKCIDKWLNEYSFSPEIILEACKRAVMQTASPSLNYVDSILGAWRTAKVKSLDDILIVDKAYESKKQLSIQDLQQPKRAAKTSKFNNMYSHNWNFEELEKLESEYIDRKLNGGK